MGLKIQPTRRIGSKITTLIAVFALVFQPISGFVASQVSNAVTDSATVTADDKNGWSYGGAVGATGEIRSNTETGGNGALYLSTPERDSYIWAIKSAGNIPLQDLNSLGFMSKTVAGSATGSPSFMLAIDTDGDLSTSGDTLNIFFEPYYTYGTTPNYSDWNTWQADRATTQFWSSQTVGELGGTRPMKRFTLDYVSSIYENATVTTYRINMGTGNPGYVAWLDKISVNNTLIADFEMDVKPVVTGENFNTHSGADYRGINVGFSLNDDFEASFKNLSIATERR